MTPTSPSLEPLKPCPFCGGKVAIEEIRGELGYRCPAKRVGCSKCSIFLKEISIEYEYIFSERGEVAEAINQRNRAKEVKIKKTLTTLWNTRPTPAPVKDGGETCGRCKGSGEISQNDGMGGLSNCVIDGDAPPTDTCPTCDGSGKLPHPDSAQTAAPNKTEEM